MTLKTHASKIGPQAKNRLNLEKVQKTNLLIQRN